MNQDLNLFTKARLAGQLAWHSVKSVFSTTTLHLSDWFRGLTASWSNPVYQTLAKKAHRNPFAGRGLRLIAQTMATVPLVVNRGDEIDAEHEVLKLLRNPNPRQSLRHFIDALVNHLYLGGELFVERRGPTTGPNRGKAKRLYLHRPDRFQAFLTLGTPVGFMTTAVQASADIVSRLSEESLRLSDDGDIVGYRLTDDAGAPHDYTIDEMLHVRIYNPTDEDRGLPLLLAAARAIEQMESADDWNKSLSANGGRVPGYFSPEGLSPGQQLKEDQVKRAEENLDERVKERRRVNLPMVLSGAFKYIGGAITPKEADFLKQDQSNGRKVSMVLGIPHRLLNDEKSSTLTDAGIDSEMKALLVLTVLPLLEFVLDELTAWLLPAFGAGLSLTYDKDQIEALQEDMTQKYRRYREAAGVPIISPEEAREALGWSPDEVNGTLYLPLGMQPAGVQNQEEPAPLRSLRAITDDQFDTLIKQIAA